MARVDRRPLYGLVFVAEVKRQIKETKEPGRGGSLI